MSNQTKKQTDARSWLRLLLLIPVIGLMYVPFYNSLEPRFMDIPFFYWYQFLWVLISSLLTFIVYKFSD